jgi:DNA-3-methyladenine glycosylase
VTEEGSRGPGLRSATGEDRWFPRDTLAGETIAAAQSLLGARLVRDPAGGAGERRVGRIVEVEAYAGLEDRASHARMGLTPRNGIMFGAPGVAYVYLVYGMHHCLNVVTGAAGYPAALLVRAVEPVAGVATMRAAREALRLARRRSLPEDRQPVPNLVPDARLAAGPGLVAASFGVNVTCTGLDLCDAASPLRLETAPADEPRPDVAAAPRIGVQYAGQPWSDMPWRFYVPGSASLSRRA